MVLNPKRGHTYELAPPLAIRLFLIMSLMPHGGTSSRRTKIWTETRITKVQRGLEF